ncbi:uncharacterized protein LOC119500412 [Sebastes umbrosus]|uniref:uncharacterized protein LOC119500412 n=1 Tax=Sebastes umbrosus TaxID=72105 RepID=UPI00189EB39B|nr:uncharacterized protein LOC119500412 [Sebastes umbrosus]
MHIHYDLQSKIHPSVGESVQSYKTGVFWRVLSRVQSALYSGELLSSSSSFQNGPRCSQRHFALLERLRYPRYVLWSSDAFLKFSIPPVTKGIRVYDETGTEVDTDVFEEVAQQPNAGVFTITFDNDSQGTSSSGSSEGTTSSASPLLDVVTNSVLDLSGCRPDDTVILKFVSCDSDDTVILDDDYSPSRKRQKEDQDAKRLVESALAKKPDGDSIVKEYNWTKGLTDSSRRQMINILAAEMTETHG